MSWSKDKSLEIFLEGAIDGIHILDENGNVVEASKSFAETLGYKREEVIGMNVSQWDAKWSKAELLEVEIPLGLNSPGKECFDTLHRKKDGTVIPVEVYTVSLVIDNRRYLQCSARDISSRLAAQEALRISEQEFRGAFESGASGMALVAPNGRLLKVNKALCELIGYTESELLKMDFQTITYPDDLAAEENLLRQLLDGKIPSYQMKKRYFDKQGHIVFVQLGVSLVRKKDGSPLYLVGQVQDITAQTQAEAKLRQSSKMASLGQMAAGVAHEINNPLAIILGKVQQMKFQLDEGEPDPTNFRSSLDRIEVTVNRISKIIRGLRLFSRSSEKDQMVVVSLSEIVSDTLELCKERFKFHDIDLRLIVQQDLKLECRPTQISQVLVNLLSNSHDAVDKLSQKWIELKAEKVGANVLRISVTDSGGGIRPEIVEKIMEPFFTTKEIGQGTGLGLSISRGIVEEHQGQVFYDDSSPHTSFVIELPRNQLSSPLLTGRKDQLGPAL